VCLQTEACNSLQNGNDELVDDGRHVLLRYSNINGLRSRCCVLQYSLRMYYC
jgi:hypothetical protein